MTRFIRNVLDGFGSAIDLLPSQKPIRGISYLSKNKDARTISDILRKDWEMVGSDLSKAIESEKVRTSSKK